MTTYLVTPDGKRPSDSAMLKLKKLYGEPLVFVPVLTDVWAMIKPGEAMAMVDGFYKGEGIMVKEKE